MFMPTCFPNSHYSNIEDNWVSDFRLIVPLVNCLSSPSTSATWAKVVYDNSDIRYINMNATSAMPISSRVLLSPGPDWVCLNTQYVTLDMTLNWDSVYSTVNSNSASWGTPSLRIDTSAYISVLDTDGIVVCFNSSNTTALIPALSTLDVAKQYDIKNKGTGNVTVSATPPDLIDGNPTVILTQYDSLRMVNDGSDWLII